MAKADRLRAMMMGNQMDQTPPAMKKPSSAAARTGSVCAGMANVKKKGGKKNGKGK